MQRASHQVNRGLVRHGWYSFQHRHILVTQGLAPSPSYIPPFSPPSNFCHVLRGYSSSVFYGGRRVTQVYSDEENGIVCYRTETGEIICEGLDEGPRYSQPASHAQSSEMPISSYRQDIPEAEGLPVFREENSDAQNTDLG